MISKRIIQEVLKVEVLNVNGTVEITETETVLNYTLPCGCCSENINIHELEYKCKKFILENGYQLEVYFYSDGTEEWRVGKSSFGWELYRRDNIYSICELVIDEIERNRKIEEKK